MTDAAQTQGSSGYPERIWLGRADYDSDYPDGLWSIDTFDDGGAEYVRADIAAEIRNEALEKAAKIVRTFRDSDHIAHDLRTGIFPSRSSLGDALAAVILGLASAPNHSDQPGLPSADGWQPIETAPEDGFRFLAYQADSEPHFYECWVSYEYDVMYFQDDADSEPEPTHWMPLPKPPAGKAGA